MNKAEQRLILLQPCYNPSIVMSLPATGSSADLKTILIPCAPISTPHVPSGTTEIPLGDNSLTAYLTVSSVLAFDGALDTRANCVGEGADTKFSIELTSSPIPFETQTIERDQTFPDKLVIQPTVNPYMPPLDPNVRFPNNDNHLFSVRLTTLLPSNKSVLGAQVSHLGMDRTMGRHLVKLLDALYKPSPAREPVVTGYRRQHDAEVKAERVPKSHRAAAGRSSGDAMCAFLRAFISNGKPKQQSAL
ncbi:hypothetical protein L198_05403 [Cryptococcus wingfieldii CBS 7118]|uniref:Uncharacterized protein n=1 Tax=Cryptococcus wingfieldii CBS 7118 TaxID=1295528 RepID=A0A1E3IYA9_9TREE|nr:hypothetical protein L198_05403 [Cryptococcus wingfieldii CBS 7118]ODN93538.1 hypothetical protein L198_05403 [Cryptococcus wingfieldii CBS 7118]